MTRRGELPVNRLPFHLSRWVIMTSRSLPVSWTLFFEKFIFAYTFPVIYVIENITIFLRKLIDINFFKKILDYIVALNPWIIPETWYKATTGIANRARSPRHRCKRCAQVRSSPRVARNRILEWLGRKEARSSNHRSRHPRQKGRRGWRSRRECSKWILPIEPAGNGRSRVPFRENEVPSRGSPTGTSDSRHSCAPSFGRDCRGGRQERGGGRTRGAAESRCTMRSHAP